MHDRRWRRIADLPWHDQPVLWRVQVRRSDRLARAQTSIGMALGGEAGARLSSRLFMPASGDTVLRLIRGSPLPPRPTPRVVGIDDWAWRRGRHYRTIVCDLERRCGIDLLPGRSSGPVARWLTAHPGVAVVSRDRAGPYAEADRTGAPGALQVADLWHLLVDASDALRHVVECHQPQLREAVRLCAAPASPASHPHAPLPIPTAAPAAPPPSRRHAHFELAFVEARQPGWPGPLADGRSQRGTVGFHLTVGLRGIACGVRKDQAAVEAAIAPPWSNRQVEGQNNRLKLIKRSI